MPEILLTPRSGQEIVDPKGNPTQEFVTWLDQATIAINSVPPLVGSGSPEGVQVASAGRWYVDTNAAPAEVYYKETGDSDTGWVVTL